MHQDLMHFITENRLLDLAYTLSLILLGYFFARRISAFIEKAMNGRFSKHHATLLSKLLFYAIVVLFAMGGLQHLGFNLSVLLGAAGVFTVAISFASQTAASNLISGIFLLFEHPFKLGDHIEVKGVSGIVESIDLLSTKLKTPENTLVRIPNEALIKSEITNLSYFHIRRFDLPVKIAFSNDVTQVKHLLMQIAAANPTVLKDPAPSVTINGIRETGMELTLVAWGNTGDISTIKNMLQEDIKRRFEEERVEMPISQLQLRQ